MNTDLGLGDMVESILELQSEGDSAVKDKFYTTVVRCSYGYAGFISGRPPKDLTYADLSLDKKSVSADAGLSKEEFNKDLTEKQKMEIAESIDYVSNVYSHFKAFNNISGKKAGKPKLNTTGRSIIRNASLFGFLLWDRLSGRRMVTDLTPKSLSLRITEKDAQIERQAKFLLNSELRDGAANKIVDYIKTKKRV
jgi:hypothetical protein